MKLCFNAKHKYILMAVAPSGKRYWMCEICKYKTDWNPDNETRYSTKTNCISE